MRYSSALPGEAQGAAEERGDALGYLPGRAPHPRRPLDERLDDDFHAAALDGVTPSAIHAAIHQQDR